MTSDEVRALLLSFQGVEDGVSYGEPSYKVAGKCFTWLRPQLDDSIVVHLDNRDERELLIEMDPATFHFTDRYRDHPIVLARIATVDPVWLKAALDRPWRKVAPKSLSKQHPLSYRNGIGRLITRSLKAAKARPMAYGDQPTITVDDVQIPLLGFGTWQLEPADARRMVAEALRIGYRHIDTAWIYKNEQAVGEGIRDFLDSGSAAREDLFLTTKIWVEHFTHDALLKQAKESADSLGTTPDLLLLHWPKTTPSFEETLGALNAAKDEGLTKSIGLSNFPSKEFRQAQGLSKARLITDQVEHHPYLGIDQLVATAAELGSSITAWSPLAQGKIADDATISELAKAHGKTNGQITLRWLIQHGIIAIPRTTKESRARENFDIFDFVLTDEEMQRMDALDRGERLGDWLDPAFEWDKTAA